MTKPPGAQMSALKWLINRNGDGMFERNNSVVLAAGERAPVMRCTWNTLVKLGFVELYQNGKRLRATDAGRALKLGIIEESRGEDA